MNQSHSGVFTFACHIAQALVAVACLSSCSDSATLQSIGLLESEKREHAELMVAQSKPAIQSVVEESAVELVNSLSFSLGFEGFNIEDQDMEVIDSQTLAFYSNLLTDPAVVEAQTRLYESTFSAEELKAIANFYSTEPGQKLLKESSRLNRSIRSAVQSRMYEQMPQYMAALKIHLKLPSSGVPVGGTPQAVQVTNSKAASDSTFK